MILYNVTLKVDKSINDEWLSWMKKTHIPEIIGTGFFHSHRICKLLGQDESDGITYAIQYFAHDMKLVHQYQVKSAPMLQKEHQLIFGDKVVAFRTLMEIIG